MLKQKKFVSVEERHEKMNISYMLKQRRRAALELLWSVTAKLISAFVFATQIVQILNFPNPTFPASGHLLCIYRHVWKPHCWFSHDAAQLMSIELISVLCHALHEVLLS